MALCARDRPAPRVGNIEAGLREEDPGIRVREVNDPGEPCAFPLPRAIHFGFSAPGRGVADSTTVKRTRGKEKGTGYSPGSRLLHERRVQLALGQNPSALPTGLKTTLRSVAWISAFARTALKNSMITSEKIN